jgi:hypothetical protein
LYGATTKSVSIVNVVSYAPSPSSSIVTIKPVRVEMSSTWSR